MPSRNYLAGLLLVSWATSGCRETRLPYVGVPGAGGYHRRPTRPIERRDSAGPPPAATTSVAVTAASPPPRAAAPRRPAVATPAPPLQRARVTEGLARHPLAVRALGRRATRLARQPLGGMKGGSLLGLVVFLLCLLLGGVSLLGLLVALILGSSAVLTWAILLGVALVAFFLLCWLG